MIRGLSSPLKHMPALPFFRFVRSLRSAALSVPRQIETEDGVVLVFQPGSLPPDTEVTIVGVRDADIYCSLDATRFLPFGYKDILFSPPLPGPLDPPARIYWRTATRFVSLEQIKFATTPSKGTNTSDFAALNATFCLIFSPGLIACSALHCLLLNHCSATMTVDLPTSAPVVAARRSQRSVTGN